jgi:bifunctional DNA-binding transcriptional regulator/antitoxin component of YhaV-PrlF toxin-antitoxin module
MPTKVGTKGQMVIEKELREQFGVLPGSLAIQRAGGDHIKVYFAPPAHQRSLRGALAKYVKRKLPATKEAWDKAREAAWEERAREKFGPR